MARKGQLTAAWEMLSTVVMLRAKAKEQQLGRLLTSLHGVEVELARIISAGDEASGQAGATECGTVVMEEAAVGRGRQRSQSSSRQSVAVAMSRLKTSEPRRRQDAQLETYSRKYLVLAEQLKELMVRGEVAATGPHALYDDGGDLDAKADSMLAEQHDLSLTIARLRASSLAGLANKAAVLDDLAEEGTDDPVQSLARSLARDVMVLNEERKVSN